MLANKKVRLILIIVGGLLLLNSISRARKATPASPVIRSESDAVRQAQAMKAYQDYQYVKYMGPISGPMYRSSKW